MKRLVLRRRLSSGRSRAAVHRLVAGTGTRSGTRDLVLVDHRTVPLRLFRLRAGLAVGHRVVGGRQQRRRAAVGHQAAVGERVAVGAGCQHGGRRRQHGRRGPGFGVRSPLSGRAPEDLPVLGQPQQADDDPAVQVAEDRDGPEPEDRLAASDVDLVPHRLRHLQVLDRRVDDAGLIRTRDLDVDVRRLHHLVARDLLYLKWRP